MPRLPWILCRVNEIYLDHNATTPVLPEVARRMGEALRELGGNPSSPHQAGAKARAALEVARGQVAELVGARPSEVIFTSGATESNAMVIHSVFPSTLRAEAGAGSRHVCIGSADHASVMDPVAHLEKDGLQVSFLNVDFRGQLSAEEFQAKLGSETSLCCLLWANNETGVVHPVVELVEAVRNVSGSEPPWIHVDAVQALATQETDFAQLGVDSLALSAHKLGGPKGVGAIIVKEGRSLSPLIRGGPQERGLRAGTENVTGILGLGLACQVAQERREQRLEEWGALRDLLWDLIQAEVPAVSLNSDLSTGLCNTLNVGFSNVDGRVLVEALDLEGIYVSSGAACSSGSLDPSHVLTAMGQGAAEARSAVRFSLGEGVTQEQVRQLGELLPKIVSRVRASGQKGTGDHG
jgi:cysteine desulfurase